MFAKYVLKSLYVGSCGGLVCHLCREEIDGQNAIYRFFTSPYSKAVNLWPMVTTTSKRSRTILIIEDEDDIRDLMVYNLEREGFIVHAAADGEAGLELAQQHTPDLILLDLMLPGLDGIEVCRQLRADNATANIPVIMVTAKGEESDVVLGLGIGADDYVTKPFSPRELVAHDSGSLAYR